MKLSISGATVKTVAMTTNNIMDSSAVDDVNFEAYETKAL